MSVSSTIDLGLGIVLFNFGQLLREQGSLYIKSEKPPHKGKKNAIY